MAASSSGLQHLGALGNSRVRPDERASLHQELLITTGEPCCPRVKVLALGRTRAGFESGQVPVAAITAFFIFLLQFITAALMECILTGA